MSQGMVLSNWDGEAQSWEWFEADHVPVPVTKATPEKPLEKDQTSR